MIKINIKMPKTCNGCFGCHEYNNFVWCCLNGYKKESGILDYVYSNTKPDWCPCMEVQDERSDS